MGQRIVDPPRMLTLVISRENFCAQKQRPWCAKVLTPTADENSSLSNDTNVAQGLTVLVALAIKTDRNQR